LLELARHSAALAGKLLLNLFDQPRTKTAKGYRDFVTDADEASQRLIAANILASHPDHGFLAEEDDPDLPDSGPVIWIVDPLDGTTNYSRQQGNYCVSIAAAMPDPARDGRLTVIAGVIHDPIRSETFSASIHQPTELNGVGCTVSDASDLSTAVIALDTSRLPHLRRAAWQSVENLGKSIYTVRAIGTAALTLAWLACGRLDGYFHLSLSDWDAAAGAILIEGAGGKITALSGEKWNPGHSGCIASNGALHPLLMENIITGQGD